MYSDDPTRQALTHPDPRDSGHRYLRPKVHLGRIGSANKAFNDTLARDGVAGRYDLRALEMEGAGIGDSAFLFGLEWMVVRGISDYGNLHRNDTWKPYAALVAAAYTRALLAATPPVEPRGGQVWLPTTRTA